MFRALLAAVILVALTVTPCLAQDDLGAPLTGAPSILGSTGALITPTTQINPETYSVGYHWLNDTFDGVFKVNLSPIEQLEVGAAFFQPAGAGADQTVFNAKYLVAEEDEDSPALAIGVWDATNEFGLDAMWYGIVSKTIDGEVPLTINLGGSTGGIVDGIFGSVIAGLHEDVDFLGEYDSSEVNFGVRVRPWEGVNVDLFSVDNGVDREFGLGAGYTSDW